jgi:HAD superfamily hydrolase (TIGR01509 family)
VRIEAVLFDIDGTLIDSNEQHVIAWALAFQAAGHPREADDIRRQIGKGGDLLVPALLPDVTDRVAKEIADQQGALFKSLYLDHVRPFDGAIDLIARVHDGGRKIVLASSAKRAELERYVDRLGIGDKLAATTSIDDVDASKPEPDIFRAALEKIGVAPDRAIVIGDTIYDIEAAARAGIVAIGLTSGPFGAKALRDAGAIAIFADVADLLANFDRSPLAAQQEPLDA